MFQHPEKYLHDVVFVPLMIFAHRPVFKMADFSPREVAFRSSGCLALVLGKTKAGPRRTKVVESDVMPLALCRLMEISLTDGLCCLYIKSYVVYYGYV